MKNALTPATTPTVFGLDVTSAGISVAKLTADNDRPGCRYIVAPNPRRSSHSVATALHRQSITTKKVLDVVLRDDIRPHIVVMGKLSWGLQTKDPSFPRRAGQWWDIAGALADHNVPTAEVPLGTASSWAMGKSPGLKADGLTALKKDIEGKWEGLAESFASAGDMYRASAVLYAAFGAMVIGLPTPYAPTEARVRGLALHRGWANSDDGTKSLDWVPNRGVQFPAAVRPVPTTVSEWNARAEALGAAIPEPDHTVIIDSDDEDNEVA